MAGLEQTVQQLEAQRQRLVRRRRRQLLLVSAMVSLLVHIGLLTYWSGVYRWRPPGDSPQPVRFEFAVEQEDELTEMEDVAPDDLAEPDLALADLLRDLEAPSVELEAEPPAANLQVLGEDALPSLGGSGGEGGAGALSGGAAGTSFFGIASKGRRFAYIVDRSGSMSEQRKMIVARRELARSVQNLPDYAFFYVVFFSSSLMEPPMQSGWTQARPAAVRRFIRSLNDIPAQGGTEPRPAFQRIFALDVRPDVIFFLTDGQISNFTADEVAAMNRRGRRVVVNTIAFGDRESQDLLKQIADDSGGAFRYVPSEEY